MGHSVIIVAVTILVAIIDIRIVTRCGWDIIGLAAPDGTFRSYGGLLLIIGCFGLLEDID
jgi:hypothetical protein